MPWGTTTFSLLYSWVARRDAGSPTNIIDATTMEAQDQDFADGLEACIKHNGDIAASAALPMGGFAHTNVGAATARTQYLRVAEYQDGGHVWVAGSGTDTITATYAPAVTSLTNGLCLRFRAAAANTSTTPTFSPNGLTAKTIIKGASTSLVASDIAGQHHECIVQYNSTDDKWHLLNPAYAVFSPAAAPPDLASLTTDSTGGATGDFLPFIDVSEANAANKVTVQDIFTNVFANFTADSTGGATSDKLLFSDASESNAAQTVTVDNFVVNSLQLLTTDSTGGATGDLIPFVDVSDSNAGNKVTVSDLFYNAMNNATAETSLQPAADHLIIRDNSASAYRKMLAQYIGAGKQTIWVPAGAMIARTTNGAASGTVETTTNKVMIRTLDFDASTDEFAQFSIQMPKGWNESTVTALFVWSHPSTATNFAVVWGIQGLAVSDDDALDTAFGTAQTVTDTGGTTNDIYRSSETSAITLAGSPAEGDVAIFQVYRDADAGGDTLAVDARLHGVALFYTTNANTDD